MGVSPITLAKAKAIALGIKGMIGEEPSIYTYDTYVEIDFSPQQQKKLIAYLDTQVKRLFGDAQAAAPELQVRFGKVLIPWGVRYLLPVGVVLFGAGFMSNSIVFGRRKR